MALGVGTRLGAYEITGELGAGGMGEVYRATDTKLGRDVAIKTLPSALAQDSDRLARFEREAKLLATLNHAHIAAIYGLDEHEGTQYLAMELVEGETLEQKLKAGALPVEDALHLALQIAEALEAAHEKGVVHRDLKPANMMVTGDGQVKVLDFGLAKAFSDDSNEASTAHSPALSMAMTQQGLILGTAGYMSPEQASGQATDQRADIWAFGVVLYEMLTGLPLFSGESVPHVLAAVLQTEPDWSRLPKNLHPRLRLLLTRCLRKKARNRYHSIADVRVDIEDILSDPHGAAEPTPMAQRAPRRALPLAAVFVIGAAAAGIAAWALKPAQSNPLGVERLSLMTPANRPVSFFGYPTRSLALSPDGTQLVYVGAKTDVPRGGPNSRGLELRSLASLAVRDLPGTDGARQPFFSPDGQWVGFFTENGELKKVSLAGGNPVTIAENINGSSWAFGIWTEDGTIVFGTVTTSLRRVSAEGGKVTDATTLDGARNELSHTYPVLVPGSRAVLFTVFHRDSRNPEIDVVTLDTGQRQLVLDNASEPLLLSGGRFLLFQREQSILIAPFDAKRLSVTGPAIPLPDKVERDSEDLVAQLAASRSGTLAYLPATDTSGELGLVSRDGSFKNLGLPSGNYRLPRVSPDGHAVAFIETRGQKKTVRIYDLQRGTKTSLAMREGGDLEVAWNPNGQSLALSSFRSKADGLFLENLDGTERQLVRPPAPGSFLRVGSWSPDGKHLSYVVQAGSQHDIWVLTMGQKPDEKPTTVPFINGAAEEINPQFSRDGRWLAFVSNESGRPEVYVQRYPKGERLPVSTHGGLSPVWSPDGKELFFQGNLAGGVPQLMAVSITPDGEGLGLGKPVGLFDLRGSGPTGTSKQYDVEGNVGAAYDVLPDGKHFVMVRGDAATGTREIVLVQNLSMELRRLLPAK